MFVGVRCIFIEFSQLIQIPYLSVLSDISGGRLRVILLGEFVGGFCY